jgi:hypothetical protein
MHEEIAMSTEQSSRDRKRAKALKPRPSASRIVEFDGEKYEVRAPSLGLQERVDAEAISMKRNARGKVERVHNPKRGGALMLIYSVFDPEDGKPIFDKADLDTIMAEPLGDGGFISTINDAMMALLRGVPSVEEEVGNSDASPSASSA